MLFLDIVAVFQRIAIEFGTKFVDIVLEIIYRYERLALDPIALNGSFVWLNGKKLVANRDLTTNGVFIIWPTFEYSFKRSAACSPAVPGMSANSNGVDDRSGIPIHSLPRYWC